METIAYVLAGLAAFVVLFLIGRRLWFGGEESFEEEEADDEGADDSEVDEETDEVDEGADDEGADDEGADDEGSEASDSEPASDADEGASDGEGADAPLMAADLAMPQIVAMPPAPAPDARAFDDLDLDTEWKWKWQYAADDVDEAKLRKTAWLKPYIDNRDIKPFDLGFDQMKENDDVTSSGKGNGKLTDAGAGADLGAMDDMAGAMPPTMDDDEAGGAMPPTTMVRVVCSPCWFWAILSCVPASGL
jgi:hypothetical protein